MLVTRRSPFSGNLQTMEIPLSEEEYIEGDRRRASGTLIQDAFPSLTADQREFLITGITPGEWEDIFG